jgi:hypothetical protein
MGKDCTWLSAAEPFESVLTKDSIVPYETGVCQGTEDLVDKLMLNMFTTNNVEVDALDSVIYVDSMRRLLYTIKDGGAAGEGGINNMLVLQLTELSNILAARGLTVVTALNPMMTDEKQEQLFERMTASVAAVAMVERHTKGKVHVREGRIDLNLMQAYERVVTEGRVDDQKKPSNHQEPETPTTTGSIARQIGQAALESNVRRLTRIAESTKNVKNS